MFQESDGGLQSCDQSSNYLFSEYDGRNWPLVTESARNGDHYRMTVDTSVSIQKPITSDSLREQASLLKDQIKGNIEVIDYLRNISCLENDFSSLSSHITKTAVKLSRNNRVKYPSRIFDEETGGNVDVSWKYVKQLSGAINWHIKKAFSYHKYHHNVWTAHVELLQTLENFVSIEESLLLSNKHLLNSNDLLTIQKLISEQLLAYENLIQKANDFTLQSRTITPIHKRSNLSPGRHSACMMASIRLSSNQYLHRGDPVKVWRDNELNDDEWNIESMDGIQLPNVPSICCWLNSPEESPKSVPKQQNVESMEQLIDNLKQKLYGIKSNYVEKEMEVNNKSVAKNFNEDLLCALDNTLKGVVNLLIPNCFSHMKELISSNKSMVQVNDLDEYEAFIRNVCCFLNYVENQILNDTLDQLTENPACIDKRTTSPRHNDAIQILYSTIKEWKRLDDLNQDAKNKYFVNWTSHQTTIKQDISIDYSSPSNFKISTSISNDMTNLNLSPIDKLDELITNFTNEAPQTYSLLDDQPIKYDLSEPIRKQERRSTSNGITTTDLMTQVDTPCFCFKYSHYHHDTGVDDDIDDHDRRYHSGDPVLSPSRYESTSQQYLEDPSIHSRRDYQSTSSIIQPAQKYNYDESSCSMPMLPIVVKDVGTGDDEPITAPPIKMKNKISRIVKGSTGKKLSKSKSMNISAGYVETTGSSGFESASDSTCKLRDLNQADLRKPPKKSFLRWYKREKQTVQTVQSPITPESPINEPGPPGRRSPINIQSVKYSKKYTQQIHHHHPNQQLNKRYTPSEGKMLRSHSWIQQTFPVGYGPVNCNSWSTCTDVNIPSDSHKNWAHLFQSDTHLLGTVDSGIQTDIELHTTISDMTMNEHKLMCNAESPDKLHQTGETQTPNFLMGKQTYDAYCQIGVVKKNQLTETCPDLLQLSKQVSPSEATVFKSSTVAATGSQNITVQTEVSCLKNSLTTSNKDNELKKSKQKLKSYKSSSDVSCQIGQYYVSTISGPGFDELEFNKLLSKSMKQEDTPIKRFGKKVQVNMDSVKLNKQEVTINTIERGSSPLLIEINQTQYTTNNTTTTDDVIPQKSMEMLNRNYKSLESQSNAHFSNDDGKKRKQDMTSTDCQRLTKSVDHGTQIVKNAKDECVQVTLTEDKAKTTERSVMTDLPYLYVHQYGSLAANDHRNNYKKSVKVVHLPGPTKTYKEKESFRTDNMNDESHVRTYHQETRMFPSHLFQTDKALHKSADPHYRRNFLVPVKHRKYKSLPKSKEHLLMDIGIYDVCQSSDSSEQTSSSSEGESQNVCNSCLTHYPSQVQMNIKLTGPHIKYWISDSNKSDRKRSSSARSYSLDDARLFIGRNHTKYMKEHTKHHSHSRKY